MIFASTGTKKPEQPKDYYVDALAGSDIQTNPPETNAALDDIGRNYEATSRELPAQSVVDELKSKVDMQKLEDTLMSEGTAKFAEPHKQLIATLAQKRAALA